VETEAILALIGGVLAVAYLGSLLFRRGRVPDVLWLLLLGGILGPWLGALDAAVVERALPLVAALALIVILFDGAMEVTPRLLRSVGARSLLLSLSVFTATSLACSAVAWLALDLPWPQTLLLGMAFGGAGIAIIVPLARRMDVAPAAMTVVLLEAVASDILVILGVYAVATAVAVGASAGTVAGTVVAAFGIGGALGLAAGWLWSRWLRIARENAYVMTFAALVVLYAMVEALNGSGPLAVLLFGILIGNSRHPHVRPAGAPAVPGPTLVAFHNELAFFIRAFFFVAVGASTDWSLLTDRGFLLAGGALAVTVAAVRFAVAHVVLLGSGLSAWDRMVTGLLSPMGLVTAAVSVIPHQMGVPGTRHFPGVAAIVIVLTNVLATVALFVAGWLHARRGRPAPAA